MEPTSGESFCSYMPGMDGRCLESFLEHLAEAYADYHLLLIMDQRPEPPLNSQKRSSIPRIQVCSTFRPTPPSSTRSRDGFRSFGVRLSNNVFESVRLIQEALTDSLAPYWRDPALLQQLTGYSWWVEAVDALGRQ